MVTDFDGQTVVVTGAANGIGAETARRFADRGARVIVTDIDQDAGQDVVATIDDEGGDAAFRELDVTDFDAFDALVEDVHTTHGLDVLVNSAGIAQLNELEDTSVEERDRLVAVNILGVWNGCRSAVARMKPQGSGSIVNVSSTGGLRGSPKLATYSLTKGAVINFTRALAGEAGPQSVRVNAVAPGTIETELATSVMDAQANPDAARDAAARGHALKRLGRPGEVADAIAYLASDRASFVTGHTLVVDGGQSAVLRFRE